MKPFLLCIISSLSAISYSQNTKSIDASVGVGDYKFGASCESLDCKIDEYGWYNIYPNLNVGGLKVNKAKIACNSIGKYYVKGIYCIELYFESKTDSDYKIIIDQLSQKYGTPSLQALINDVRSWEGKYVSITSTHEDTGQIVVVYVKKQATKEVGF